MNDEVEGKKDKIEYGGAVAERLLPYFNFNLPSFDFVIHYSLFIILYSV
jgi:hypothetical protein